MDVSVIIVNYNTTDLVINVINTIFDKTLDIEYEIIIIDNNSIGYSEAILLDRFGDKIKFISLNENIGFGRANNEGIKIAKGRNILFLNPDTFLLNNAIKILSDFLDSNEKVGICGGNLFDENMRPIHSYRMIFPSIIWEINNFLGQVPEKIIFGKNSEFNHTKESRKVAYITGADLMIKKAVLSKTGEFSPTFFMYYEETDLCFRVKKNFFHVVSVPEAEIIHLEGKSFTKKKELNTKRIKILEESRKAFYKLNYSFFYQQIADVIYYINIYSRIIVFYLLKNKKYHYWKTILNYFKLTKNNGKSI